MSTYVRKTEECANTLVKKFLENGDLADFIYKVADWSAWYGTYGATNRYLFIDEVVRLLSVENIKITYQD